MDFSRFISADNIVPRADDAQVFNRYAYARNSPVMRVDPSGHADCGAGENSCWQIEWDWKNRWYEAHGHFWENGFWSRKGLANFHDEGILRETLSEAGITFEDGILGKWLLREMSLVGQGVVALANKIDVTGGGLEMLRRLLGGRHTQFARINTHSTLASAFVGLGEVCICGGANIVTFFENILAPGSEDWARGTAVHELGHVINYNSESRLATSVPWIRKEEGYDVGKYARKNRNEYFSETLTQWVFDSPQGNPYRQAIGLGKQAYHDDLRVYMEANLTR